VSASHRAILQADTRGVGPRQIADCFAHGPACMRNTDHPVRQREVSLESGREDDAVSVAAIEVGLAWTGAPYETRASDI
jgi:hypothetical protein